MVIVSSKHVPLPKKKSANSGKPAVVNNARTKPKPFARPAPRSVSISTVSVGAGRGKVKTTRNNTLPLPSPKSGLVNANGPRIHAQRKFAQGATATFNSTGLGSVHSSYSPSATPTKDSSKFKKRILTPISPPLKRPKTEDFLTFLCFRGTPSLPTDLEYFNYPQSLQVEDVAIRKKKPKQSVSTGVGSTSQSNGTDSQNSVSSAPKTSSGFLPPQPPPPARNVATKHAENNGSNKSQNGKQSGKVSAVIKRVAGTVIVKRTNGVSSSTSQASAENKTSKVVNKTPAPAPQISPSASRINEQDARFAMTALKLKYQEKRLANARPAKSLITMLTKKVKERSMVLTRSRAKTAVGPLKTNPAKRKLQKPPARQAVKPLPRNAPSPDIILGVAHSPVKPVDSKRSSTSESDSQSEPEKKSSSSESSSSSSESEEEPTTRSLRSGKAVVAITKPKVITKTSTSKRALPNRVGTRSSHRHTKSPLRELPMWNVNIKKKKILAKYKKNAKAKAKPIIKKSSPDITSSSTRHVTRSSLKKVAGFSKGRPSRKTKETAAIYLLNKDFSSDDEDSIEEAEKEEKASSSGDSSSSESKFLEKQYNASIKRTTQPKDRPGSSSSNRLRSQNSSKKEESSSSGSKSNNNRTSKTAEKDKKSTTKKKEEKPLPRVLRSSGSVDSNKTESSIAAKRRLLLMTCGKDTAGAARKSAKIVSRGRGRHYSSSSNDESRESSSDEVEEEEEDEDNEINFQSSSEASEGESNQISNSQKQSRDSPVSLPSSRGSRARAKRVTELIEETRGSDRSCSPQSSNRDSPVDHKSISSDSKSIASEMRRLVEQQQTDTGEEMDEDDVPSPAGESLAENANLMANEKDDNDDTEMNGNNSSGESQHSDDSESGSSSSEEESDDEPEPEKTTIGIQVDMDLEEEEEAKRLQALSIEASPSPQELQPETPPVLPPPDEPEHVTQSPQPRSQPLQDEDDEIQEIGQVINNPSSIRSSSSSNRHQHATSSSPLHQDPIIRLPPGPSHSSLPGPIPMSIPPPPPLPPLSSRTASLTYTSHLGNPSVPFVPYSRPSSDYYPPPPFSFGPTHLVNSIHLVGSATGGGVDFASELANPLSTLSIPVSVPTLSSFPNPLFPPPPPPISLGPPGATMTATSLQTHIRTVATNLDIPLVRPVIGHDTTFPMGMGMGQPSHFGSIPLVAPPPPTSVTSAMNNLLSRPLGPWPQPSADIRNHYSAFRLPSMTPVSSAPSTIGMKDILRPSTSSTLPVSIVHPRTHPQQALHHHHHLHPHSISQQLPGHASVHHHSHHSISTTHVVHNIREIHHHTSSTPSASVYMQSYNPESIIRNLPNVSIVPKFDRSSVKTQLPSQNPSGSSSSKKHSNSKHEEMRKLAKKKKSTTLPTPSSPLTVRKDSVNPATYTGLSSKSKKKETNSSTEAPPVAPSASPKTTEPEQSQSNSMERESDSSKFDKLLQLKQEVKTPEPSSSSSSSNIVKQTNPIRVEDIKREIVTPWVSPSKKIQSSASSNKKTPDKPSSSSSISSNCQPAKKRVSKILEAPTYHPTDQEFEDPLKYIDKIQSEAEKYGMARIVPPRSFRPECNVNDDMRFTAYNHYIHKMFKRWGPTVQETEAIKEHLKRSDQDVTVPVIGGMEIDFSTLYQTVQSFGGLQDVIEKEKWSEVADLLHIPKGTHDRATKLDAAYVKYILPYHMLSEEERTNLNSQVQQKWTLRQQKLQERTDESSEDETSDEDSMDELDDCVIKGKGTALSSYYRVARNTVGMVFANGKEPPIPELENEYWKIVREGKKHLCVYSGSIDCAGVGWGFPVPKPSAKHPWNLKVLANNPSSVLRSMGPVMGATVPTLHVSMLYTSYCWYRDPHGLPWVEYLHSGASKIWYSVAAAHEQILRKALMELMPLQCKNKKVWLPSDSAMVPPELLLEKDVPLVRTVQNPGEFLVVFAKSYTSAICTGYLVSESVCFAPPAWLKYCTEVFKDIKDSKEPPVFPMEKLILSIIKDNRVSNQVIKMASPLAEKIITEELSFRKKLISLGVSQGGKPSKKNTGKGTSKKKRPTTEEEEVEQCYFCNYILSMSLVRNERTDFVTCLPHAVQHLSRHKAQIKKCTLLCEETQEELDTLLQAAKRRANS